MGDRARKLVQLACKLKDDSDAASDYGNDSSDLDADQMMIADQMEDFISDRDDFSDSLIADTHLSWAAGHNRLIATPLMSHSPAAAGHDQLTATPLMSPLPDATGHEQLTATPHMSPLTDAAGHDQLTATPLMSPLPDATGYEQLTATPHMSPLTDAAGHDQLTATPLMLPLPDATGHEQLTATPHMSPLTDAAGHDQLTATPLMSPLPDATGHEQLTATPLMSPMPDAAGHDQLTAIQLMSPLPAVNRRRRLAADHQVAGTSSRIPTLPYTEEEDPFASDFSDLDPSYFPETDVESSDTDVAHKNGAVLIPESSERDYSEEIAVLVLEDLLQKVWISVRPITRRKRAKPSEWKINISQKRKADGLPFVTKGKVRSAKVPKPLQGVCCKRKCTDHFFEEDRERLCRNYWNMDFKSKKNFVLSCMKVEPVKTRKVLQNPNKKGRTYSKKCFFQKDGGEVQVCQKYFISTLCISADVITDAIAKQNDLGFYDNEDQRGKKEPPNKTSPIDVQFVEEHIESFPVMESHYCRKDSKRKYLAPDLKSVSKMYELYIEKCSKADRIPVNESKYRDIFNAGYNLSFFKLKKDLCVLCSKYNKAVGEEKAAMEENYHEHVNRKTISANAKEADKDRSNCDPSFMSITIDLQAILQIPTGGEGVLYYLRKLVLYNFTIYEARLPNNAYCLCWSEINGKKGSSEIGTFLFYYLSKLVPEQVKHLTMFSDTCSGQNRNQYIAALLLWTVQNVDHLEIIEQKFLESGHTYMEVDSMHASIEDAAMYRSINCVSDWKNVFKSARKKRAKKTAEGTKYYVEEYRVKEFKYNEMFDLKKLAETLINNRQKDNFGEKVNWMKIKRIKFVKGDKYKMYFNYDLSEDLRYLDVSFSEKTAKTPKTRSRKNTDLSSVEELVYPERLELLYEHPLPISAAKKKDLLTICAKGIIPEELHPWIRSLKVAKDIIVNDDEDLVEN